MSRFTDYDNLGDGWYFPKWVTPAEDAKSIRNEYLSRRPDADEDEIHETITQTWSDRQAEVAESYWVRQRHYVYDAIESGASPHAPVDVREAYLKEHYVEKDYYPYRDRPADDPSLS